MIERPLYRAAWEELDVPAVQLTNEGDAYRRSPNGEQTILVAPAWSWIPRLP